MLITRPFPTCVAARLLPAACIELATWFSY
jgi:hypothetical protein